MAVSSSNLIRSNLLELGFVIEESKCEWYPKQTIVWLGFEWNADMGILKVTSERIDKATKIIEDVLESVKSGQNSIHVKVIASIAGQFISMEAAVGQAVNVHTRGLYQDILSRFNWHSVKELCSKSIEELKFWRENISILNSDHIRVHRSSSDLNVYSNASVTGYGAFI